LLRLLTLPLTRNHFSYDVVIWDTGTLSDKIAAMTLLIQGAPLLRLKTLDNLINMAGKGDRRCSQMALEAVKDLMIHNLLPDRKLKTWSQHQEDHSSPHMPPSNSPQYAALLALWYFEDQIKRRYSTVVQKLEKASFDTVQNYKKVCMIMMAVSDSSGSSSSDGGMCACSV